MAEWRIPICRPSLPPFEEIEGDLREIWGSGTLTMGPFTRRLEEGAAGMLGVSGVVAVSSCTSGLMMVWRALGLRGEVIVPSFTFTATVEALVWNGLTPVFADCLPGTGTIDPASVARAVGQDTVAICPVTVFGLPPDIEALETIARENDLAVVYDSAQGLGARYRGKPLGGFGNAEVFSMSPTKVATAMEGGLVATNDPALAAKARSLRDYGKVDKGMDFFETGLSARMPEVCAAVAWRNLQRLEESRSRRETLIARYRSRLDGLPGITFQEIPEDRRSGLNYVVVFIGEGFPGSRDGILAMLDGEGIQAKPYFYPPVHRHSYLRGRPRLVEGGLPETERIASSALALPLYNEMTAVEVDLVAGLIREHPR